MTNGGERRRWERRVPSHPVRVAAESETGRVPGEVLDLSAGGACLSLEGSPFAVGDEVIVWLSFAGPPRPVPATARIVWASESGGRPRYGVQWTNQGPHRSWIGQLIGA